MSETLFGAIIGAIIGSGLTIIAQWWWDRRTRWLEQRRDAYVRFLFAIDDFIGTIPAHAIEGHVPFQTVGRSIYRSWTEFRIVAPTKGRTVEAADAAFAVALSLASTGDLREGISDEEWRALQGELMAARGRFFDGIRADLGLGPVKPDPFREVEDELRAARERAGTDQQQDRPRRL